MSNPIKKFNQWFKEELAKSKAAIPSACCLSTIGLDGFPNARFLSLKKVIDDTFIITGPLNSLKGKEIEAQPKVALTFWWEATQRQVRIQGTVKRISLELANTYFQERNQASKVVSTISKQGMTIEDVSEFEKLFLLSSKELEGKAIDKPEDWGGFSITPTRIELMEFKDTRFHFRECYSKFEDGWHIKNIQP